MRKNPNNVEQLITTNCRRDLLGVNEISLFCSNWFFQGSCFYESCFSIFIVIASESLVSTETCASEAMFSLLLIG